MAYMHRSRGRLLEIVRATPGMPWQVCTTVPFDGLSVWEFKTREACITLACWLRDTARGAGVSVVITIRPARGYFVDEHGITWSTAV